eukprot:SAG31_NODE_2671_length_5270_cov_5.903114_3_plen_53_part_00
MEFYWIHKPLPCKMLTLCNCVDVDVVEHIGGKGSSKSSCSREVTHPGALTPV